MYRFIFSFSIFLSIQTGFAQIIDDGIKNSFFVNAGGNTPLINPFSYSGDHDPTNGKGYKTPGIHIAISQALTSKNKGIISTFFYSTNGYDNQRQMTDDNTITKIDIGTWQTIGFLSGYYRNFVFKKRDFISIDMKIQGGVIYGDYPVSHVDYDLGQGATKEVFYFDSWTSGVMVLAGVGIKFKTHEGKDAFRFGLEYSIGHINHVVEKTTLDYQFPQSTTTYGTGVIHSDYYGVNLTLGYVFHL
jgi:hypothetical protein